MGPYTNVYLKEIKADDHEEDDGMQPPPYSP